MANITIPAEIVRVARSAVLTELGGAAADIEQASIGYEKEEHPEAFVEPLQRFDALRGLLDMIGWRNETPRTMDIRGHGLVLAKALAERLELDRYFLKDKSIEAASRKAVEGDVRRIEAFLAATDLSEEDDR